MNIEDVQAYCVSLPHATEDMPFGDEWVTFRVGGKVFCLAYIVGEPFVNLKCDPDEALDIREAFSAVTPAYHMNKRLWNTVKLDGTVSDSMIRAWIKKSYTLVAKGLTRKKREELGL